MSSKKVSFNDNNIVKYYAKNSDDSNDSDHSTDYEEEHEDPKDLIRKLLTNRSFGTEEYGNDYESNTSLKRNVEASFGNLKNHAYNQFYIPDFKAINKMKKDECAFANDKKNNLQSIFGKDYDKTLNICETCSELLQVNYNNCQVCSRETVDVRCNNCVPNLFDLCSPKCREIFEGSMAVIEITNDNDEPFIVIEDDNQNMVLTVTNHKLFYQELSQKDLKMIKKLCPNCNPECDINDNAKYSQAKKNHFDQLLSGNDEDGNMGDNEAGDREEDEDEDLSRKNKIGVIPLKCHNCSENYSYIIACGECYHKSGLQYLCDDCEGI